MEAILRKAWNLQVGFDVVEINDNTFMFNFSSEEKYCRILRGRSWSINGFYLNLLDRSRTRWRGDDCKGSYYNNRYHRCFLRARVGHDNRICRSERLMSMFNPTKPRFGAWLMTGQCRSWDEVLVVVCNEWSEASYVTRKWKDKERTHEVKLRDIQEGKEFPRDMKAKANDATGTPILQNISVFVVPSAKPKVASV
ncbi:hypothetical protein K1719_026503 [Acacia pycnantha]|nr:hypothetical protein K1719_026503 [Acacia pycnantha]